MPIPRKLLQAAFELLPETTLRKVAEHHDIRGRASASREELCLKLSRDDGTRLQSYTSYFTVPELKAIATLFGIEVKGKKKNDLDSAVWGFVQDYDKISRKLTYDDVFANTRSADFGAKFGTWMQARHSTLKPSEWSEGEKVLWLIRYALMDINGNSFPGVYESGGNDRPEKFAAALREVGANKSAKAFEEIGRILFGGDVPGTMKARVRALTFEDEKESDEFDRKLDQCRKIWDMAGEDITALSVRFAAKNPRQFFHRNVM